MSSYFVIIPKFKKRKKETVNRSIRNFIIKYKPKTAYIINLSLDSEIKIENTTVYFIPYTKLFTEDSIYR